MLYICLFNRSDVLYHLISKTSEGLNKSYCYNGYIISK